MPAVALPPHLWTPPKPAVIRPADTKLIRSARGLDLRERRAGLVPFPFYLTPAATFATRTHTAGADVTAATTTPNFGTVSLGSPAGTSLVVVIFYAWNGGTNGTALSSVTIDGGAASVHQNVRQGILTSGYTIVAIASRATSNTSGAVSASCAQQMSKFHIEVYRLNNLTSATPDNSNNASANASTTNANLAVTSPGIAIAGGGIWNAASGLITISGVSQDNNGQLLAPGDQWVSGSDQNQPTNASRNISVANTGGTLGCVVCMASWH